MTRGIHRAPMSRALCAAVLLAAGPATSQGQGPGAHFIENWDDDGDGRVTLEEAEAKRADVFYMFDSDEDGFLDSEEYDRFDETRAADMEAQGGHAKGAMAPLEQGMSRAFNDTDGDGKVSADEFTAATGSWITQADRDGDGAVTAADFGPGAH